MRLLLTRPEADARTLAAQLEAAGHKVGLEPLLTVEPVGGAQPFDLNDVQALILTSRNTLRVLGTNGRLDKLRHLPVLTVGPGTTAAARDAGFTRILAGPAAAADLTGVAVAALDPKAGALLHLSGEEIATDLTAAPAMAGFTVRREVVYRTIARTHFSSVTQSRLQAGDFDGVVLMSPRTATVYAALILSHGLGDRLGGLVHICLSTAVADRLTPLGDVVKAICPLPNSEELLALINRIAPQSRVSLDHDT